MRAYVVSVREEAAGSVLAADLSIGDPRVELLDGSDFSDDGGEVTIAGQTFAYSGMLLAEEGEAANDTLVLAGTSPVAGTATPETAVTVPDTSEIIAQVRRVDGSGSEDAVVSDALATHKALQPGASGALVRCERQSQGSSSHWVVTRIIAKKPAIVADHIDPTSKLPAGPLTRLAQENESEMAGIIPASSIGAGRIAAAVDVSNLSAGSVKLGTSGLRYENEDGGVGFAATPDGIHVAGTASLNKLAVSNGGQLGGTTTGAQGGSFVMGGGTNVPPPPVPPTGTEDWPSLSLDGRNLIPANRHSVAIQSTTVGYASATNPTGLTRLWKFNPTDGSFIGLVNFKPAPTLGAILSMGYSSLHDLIKTLEYDAAADSYYVRSYSPGSATYDHQLDVTSHLGTGPERRPALDIYSTGGVEYLTLARCRKDGTVDIYRYEDEAYTATWRTSDSFDFVDLECCASQAWIVYLTGNTHMTNSTVYPGRPVMPTIWIQSVFGSTPGDTAGYLPVAKGDPSGSLATLSGDSFNRTWYLSRGANILYQHGDIFRADQQCAVATYYDPVTGHESEPSDPLFFNYTPGSRRTFTLGAPPAGFPSGLEYRIYWGKVTVPDTYPGNANMWLQGATTNYSIQVFNVLITGTNLTASRTGITAPDSYGLFFADGIQAINGNKEGWLVDVIGGSA